MEPSPFFHPSATVFSPPADAPVRRKRGRPRKYGLPPPSFTPSDPPRKDPKPSPPPDRAGKAGQCFTPHAITVATGEDVAQKIMSFIQKSRHAVCIFSASGALSKVSLRHPSNMGSVIVYEGSFEIISLSGSFLHVDIKGASSRAGGISTCLAGSDGRIIGGGVGGPLIAAGPVQVIAASFSVNNDQDSPKTDTKGELSSGKLFTPELVGTKLVRPSSSRSSPDSSGGNNNMLHYQGMRGVPSRFSPTNEEVKMMDASEGNNVIKMGMDNLFVTRFSS